MSVVFNNTDGDFCTVATGDVGGDRYTWWNEVWYKHGGQSSSTNGVIVLIEDGSSGSINLFVNDTNQLYIWESGSSPYLAVNLTVGGWYRCGIGVSWEATNQQKFYARVMASGSDTLIVDYTVGPFTSLFTCATDVSVGAYKNGTFAANGEFRSWFMYRGGLEDGGATLPSDAAVQSNRTSEVAVYTTNLFGQYKLQTITANSDGTNSSAGSGGVNAVTNNITTGSSEPTDFYAAPVLPYVYTVFKSAV